MGSGRWRLGYALVSVMLWACSLSLQAQERQQPPRPQQLQSSTLLVRERYRSQYADSTPEGRRELASELLKQARLQKEDAAARYALLSEARELAVHGGGSGLTLALVIIDATAAEYVVDPDALKLQAFLTAALQVEPGDADQVATVGLHLMEQMIASDHSSLTTLVGTLQPIVSQAKSETLRARFKAAQNAVAELERGQVSLKRLKTNADDPELNLAAGRYLCVTKGDFDAGLPMLVKGSDAKLKMMAQEELSSPSDAIAQKALADQWYDYAQTLASLTRAKVLHHAGDWYIKAYPASTGLARIAISKRMEELGRKPEELAVSVPVVKAESAPAPVEIAVPITSRTSAARLTPVPAPEPVPAPKPPPVEWVDLLKTASSRNATGGRWKLSGSVLKVLTEDPSQRIAFDADIEQFRGAYDLQVRFIRNTGEGDVNIIFPAGHARAILGISIYGGTLSALYIKDTNWKESPAAVRPGTIENEREYKLDLHIEPQGKDVTITARLDGNPYLSWRGPQTSLQIQPAWTIPDHKYFGVGVYKGKATFLTFRAKPSEGPPARLFGP